MIRAVFIGDEVSAMGYRLAGLDIEVPPQGEELAALEKASRHAELVLLTAEIAHSIPPRSLERYLSDPRTLVVVLPDVQGRSRPTDFVSQIRARLGIGEEITKEA